MTPHGNRIHVVPDEEIQETESGLLLTAKKDVPTHVIGTIQHDVPQVGPKGTRVMYTLAMAQVVDHDGQGITLVPADAILALVEA